LILRTAIEVTRIVSAWIDSPETPESHLLKLGQTWAGVEMYPTFFHPACGCRWDKTP
jgi:hypothetical protein